MSGAHSPNFQLLHLRHSSFWFSKLSVTSLTSQLILQPFPRFTYVTTHSPTLPLLHLRHSSFSNPSFASPTPQALHWIHLVRHPWWKGATFVQSSVLQGPSDFWEKESPSVNCQWPRWRAEEWVEGQGTLLSPGEEHDHNIHSLFSLVIKWPQRYMIIKYKGVNELSSEFSHPHTPRLLSLTSICKCRWPTLVCVIGNSFVIVYIYE